MRLDQLHTLIAETAPIYGVDSDGNIHFYDEATDEQREAAALLMAQLLPQLDNAPRPILSVKQFRDRFTDAEMLGILAAAKTDANIELLLFKLQTRIDIDTADAAIVAGMDYLVTAGLVTEARKTEILG